MMLSWLTLRRKAVRKVLAFVIPVCVIGASAFVWAHQTRPVSNAPTPSVDEVLKAVRSDLQSGRADIIAKNVTLSAAEAAKFWPVFEKYQAEQNAIMDEQMKGIQQYVDKYPNLDDATALSLINAHFDRDARMSALRQKWLAEFQQVVPVRTAVRVMQIDRRLSLAHQVEFAARIPLVH
jgi:hypothetical protein